MSSSPGSFPHGPALFSCQPPSLSGSSLVEKKRRPPADYQRQNLGVALIEPDWNMEIIDWLAPGRKAHPGARYGISSPTHGPEGAGARNLHKVAGSCGESDEIGPGRPKRQIH